jgi:hypothetical protein
VKLFPVWKLLLAGTLAVVLIAYVLTPLPLSFSVVLISFAVTVTVELWFPTVTIVSVIVGLVLSMRAIE